VVLASVGKLLPLPLARLPPLLSLCLSLLVIHAKSTVSAATFPARVSAESILDGLREQGIETALGRELLALYGSVARKGGAEAEEWVLEQEDARRMIRETGRGLLMKLDVRQAALCRPFRAPSLTCIPLCCFSHSRTSRCR
jgi:hypothetical protein